MKNTLEEYFAYLKKRKNISENTEISYRRDLRKLMTFLETQGIKNYKMVTSTNLNSYILFLEKEGLSNASISRNIASIKGYFDYLFKQKLMNDCVTEYLESPKIEHKEKKLLTQRDLKLLLEATEGHTLKSLRDQMMLQLLYATGIQTLEMLRLRVADVNLEVGFIRCSVGSKEHMISINEEVRTSLHAYLSKICENYGNTKLCDEQYLFSNIHGKQMSRQGFWKNIKEYARIAGIKEAVTPNIIRHSVAVYGTK
ncbi:tyrosine-type recombinase/integrase [Lachnospiraceae bacterium LCP25S3_G4]